MATHCVSHCGHAYSCYWVLKCCLLLHIHEIVSIIRCRIWIMWKNVSAIVILLGWHDQCQLLYHKWWSWWNTQSYAACCCTGDSQPDLVNVCILSCSQCRCKPEWGPPRDINFSPIFWRPCFLSCHLAMNNAQIYLCGSLYLPFFSFLESPFFYTYIYCHYTTIWGSFVPWGGPFTPVPPSPTPTLRSGGSGRFAPALLVASELSACHTQSDVWTVRWQQL